MSYVDLFPLLALAVAVIGALIFDVTGRKLDREIEAEREKRRHPAE